MAATKKQPKKKVGKKKTNGDRYGWHMWMWNDNPRKFYVGNVRLVCCSAPSKWHPECSPTTESDGGRWERIKLVPIPKRRMKLTYESK